MRVEFSSEILKERDVDETTNLKLILSNNLRGCGLDH
jgi:hypothetical protein